MKSLKEDYFVHLAQVLNNSVFVAISRDKILWPLMNLLYIYRAVLSSRHSTVKLFKIEVIGTQLLLVMCLYEESLLSITVRWLGMSSLDTTHLQ